MAITAWQLNVIHVLLVLLVPLSSSPMNTFSILITLLALWAGDTFKDFSRVEATVLYFVLRSSQSCHFLGYLPAEQIGRWLLGGGWL
jgi:hypothetical protein